MQLHLPPISQTVEKPVVVSQFIFTNYECYEGEVDMWEMK
jgi:hypothetical protein